MNFKNIAGYSSEKKNLEEVCHLIRHYDEITQLGLHLPTGVLLLGQPGVGKTALAEALICESDVPCIRVNHSELTSSIPLSKLLKERFEEAAEKQPSILFLDEMEKLLGNSISNSAEVGILLNAIQCYHKPGVLLVATANKSQYIPDSLRRSGRFDRVFHIPLPSLCDRVEIIQRYLNKQKLEEGFTVDEFARITEGISGADIECLINEIGIRNMFDGRTEICRQDVARAISEKLLNGISRPTEQSESLSTVAYHEAGHLVTSILHKPEGIEYATIRAQGKATGHVCSTLPLRNRSDALAQIRIMISGRCAERLFLDDCCFGAADDYRCAFQMADDIVVNELCYGVEFYKRGYNKDSDEKLRMCEAKTEEIIRGCEEETTKLLDKHRALVETFAKLLLEKYTLQKEEILQVYNEYVKNTELSA